MDDLRTTGQGQFSFNYIYHYLVTHLYPLAYGVARIVEGIVVSRVRTRCQ